MSEVISKDAVIKILDEMMTIAKTNWADDEVLVDMIIVIKDRVLNL